ncbi:histone H5 [Orussus abietinus]|uniref:histone H5 n=1 Tax=Orussus abietinus TaxID=222816 RepID=UPI000625AFEA|nr:histone H5 [Orussus abietinus]
MSVRKSARIEALVVDAIRRLQDAQGSTYREISNYISQEYDVPGSEINRQIQLALRKGVSYGILRKTKGGCYTCNRDIIGLPGKDAIAEACGKTKKRKKRMKKKRSGGKGRGLPKKRKSSLRGRGKSMKGGSKKKMPKKRKSIKRKCKGGGDAGVFETTPKDRKRTGSRSRISGGTRSVSSVSASLVDGCTDDAETDFRNAPETCVD